MKLIEVSSPAHIREFHRLPVRLYQNEPHWIRPLDKDIEAVFDPQANKTFRHGECIRWILQDAQGQTIGRIAAFVDQKRAKKGNKQPTGGVGFFDCIDSQEAANRLFDAGKEWLQARGMEAMDGPINFGERDRWWGLLVEGFQLPPNYCMPYNFPYYRTLFENYGFQLYFKQFTYGRPIMDPVVERVREKAALIAQDPNYRFMHLRKSQIEKFTQDFRTIYNQAWAKHGGVPEMSSLQATNIMKQLKPVMDEKVMWFGYHQDRPIAFFIMIPELNQSFQHLNGQFNLLRKLQFLWYHRFRKQNRKVLGLVFGVVPEFQGKGVDGGLVAAVRHMVQEEYRRYDYLEMNWIGDFNPKMMVVANQVGGTIVKTHYTYRYLFDRTLPFERMPIIGGHASQQEE
jgi:hypothetical protein